MTNPITQKLNAGGKFLSAVRNARYLMTLLLGFAACASHAESTVEFYGEVRFESRGYVKTGEYPKQAKQASGWVIEPEFYVETDAGGIFKFAPFYRYDNSDDQRRHADIREAYFMNYGDIGNGEWEFKIGIDHVLWGVGELATLVDIVNQDDVVEDFFGKINLGQSMVQLTLANDWGVSEFFVLPNHRSRVYPGVTGRLRAEPPIDNDRVEYEDKKGDDHVDFAVRYSNSVGAVDFALSAFEGTAREPSIQWRMGKDSRLAQVYEQIRQYGLDLSLVAGDFLLKSEVIRRENFTNNLRSEKYHKGEKEDYLAYMLGGEYTFYEVFDSELSVDFIGEWYRDDREEHATNPNQDDLFTALRLDLNDVSGTQLVFGLIQDFDYDSETLVFEFSRRLSDDWSVEVNATSFINTDPKDLVQYPTRQDDHIDLVFAYHF